VQEVVSFNRDFTIWHYTVSYSQLLFRSMGDERTVPRIDVLFSHVSFMHIPPTFQQLSIWTDNNWNPPGQIFEDARGRWYILKNTNFYVRATHCQWHEDFGNHHSASHFGPLRGVE